MTKSTRKRRRLLPSIGDVQDLRDKAQQNLSEPCDNDDLNFMVQSVKALIVTNHEIWERCQREGMYHAKTNEDGHEHGHRDGRRSHNIIMARYCYKEATARKKVGHRLKIKTQMQLETKDFGSFPAIPSALADIIAVDPFPSSNTGTAVVIPDYIGFYNKAALLEDGVLLSFLNMMQKHLGDVQVFLGQVEEWLREPYSNVNFLHSMSLAMSTHPKNFKVGAAAKEQEQRRSERTSKYPSDSCDICVKCLQHPRAHILNVHEDSDDSDSDSSSDDSSMDEDSSLYGLFKRNYCRESGKAASYYSPPKAVTIFSTDQVSDGNAIDFTFELGTEDGRERLKSFLNFVQMY